PEVDDVLRLQGVGQVVWEPTVEFEVERHDLEREAAEDRRDHLAGHAVARVDDDLQRPDRLGVDHRENMVGEVVEDLLGVHRPRRRRIRELVAQDEVADLPNPLVHTQRARLLAAQLEAVVLRRAVGGRHHDARVVARLADGEVEAVGTDQADVTDIRALVEDTVDDGAGQSGGRDAHVAPDHDLLGLEIDHERPADLVGDLRVEFLRVDAPYVVRLEDLRDVLHRTPYPCWWPRSGTRRRGPGRNDGTGSRPFTVIVAGPGAVRVVRSGWDRG